MRYKQVKTTRNKKAIQVTKLNRGIGKFFVLIWILQMYGKQILDQSVAFRKVLILRLSCLISIAYYGQLTLLWTILVYRQASAPTWISFMKLNQTFIMHLAGLLFTPSVECNPASIRWRNQLALSYEKNKRPLSKQYPWLISIQYKLFKQKSSRRPRAQSWPCVYLHWLTSNKFLTKAVVHLDLLCVNE